MVLQTVITYQILKYNLTQYIIRQKHRYHPIIQNNCRLPSADMLESEIIIKGICKNLMMDKFDVIVIGGGAAGICAAISAARAGQTVVICEKMPSWGKKY